MLQYPFGGGEKEFGKLGTHLIAAHNTWIDIGKDFGVLPFALFLYISLLHLYYFIKILFDKSLSKLIKYQVFILMCSVCAVLMLEPVFSTIKTFFIYLFFIFGFIARLYHARRKIDL